MSQKKETFEIDGILFDYYDFTLAKMAVSEAILNMNYTTRQYKQILNIMDIYIL